MTALERFLPLLVEGDTDLAVGDLAPGAEIFDVLQGRIVAPVVYSFLVARHMWLRDRAARVEPVAVVSAGGRSVVESVLHLEVERRAVALPVAVAADEEPDGKLRLIRIYHSTWPLTGRHALRRPLLPPDEDLRLAEPVASYQRALAAGDVEGVLAVFADDAYVREPAGGEHRHEGAEGRRAFYEAILARGGIPLDHATAIDDGRACALEYTVVRWGATALPPQAGCAVYERASSRLLAAARIYDDVEPPRAKMS